MRTGFLRTQVESCAVAFFSDTFGLYLLQMNAHILLTAAFLTLSVKCRLMFASAHSFLEKNIIFNGCSRAYQYYSSVSHNFILTKHCTKTKTTH